MTRLRGIARFTFTPGGAAEFKRLSAQCMDIVRAKEPGTLQYDVYLSEDEATAVVYEEYVDSAALIAHAENIGELMAPIMATATVEGELLGDASSELRSMLAGGEQPRLLQPYLSK